MMTDLVLEFVLYGNVFNWMYLFNLFSADNRFTVYCVVILTHH